MAGAAVERCVAQLGVPVDRFSGVSCRKGGITTAILANVTEEIIYLQSGHGTNRPCRNYMVLRDEQTRPLETFAAFDL